jgi:hypothetical protein
LNNPSRYTDPTGHIAIGNGGLGGCNALPDICSGHSLNDGGESSSGRDTLPDLSKKGKPNLPGSSGRHDADIAKLALVASGTPSENQEHNHWCRGGDEIDCALSAVGFVATGVATATMEVPVIAGIAVAVDVVVTVVSIGRTEDVYNAGTISNTRRWLLNGTGIVGLLPIGPGIGASLANLLFTATGYPE